MSNHLKFCSCRGCRAGRRTKSGGSTVKAVIRASRRKTKQALKAGDEPVSKVSVPYTD